MKPELKAKEIYNLYWDLLFIDRDVRNAGACFDCNQCCIIAVDEIIESDPSHPLFTTGAEWEEEFLTIDRVNIDPIKYWNSVKKSFTKL